MICSKCGRQNEDNGSFCNYCGEKLLKICPECKAEVEPTVDICPECGAYINRQIQKNREPVSYSPKRKLIFTMAILSNVFSSFFGFIFGIIAWSMGNKEIEKYPRDWMVRVGRIVGKIFTFVSIGVTLFLIAYVLIIITVLGFVAHYR